MNVNIGINDDNDYNHNDNNEQYINDYNHISNQKKRYQHLHLNSNSIKNDIDINLLMPPNPLLPRKFIRVNSPKFGDRKDYIKLPKFNLTSFNEKFDYKENQAFSSEYYYLIKRDLNQQDDNSCSSSILNHHFSDYTKETSIDSYVNNPKMLLKLVYYKNKLLNDGKISLDNIVNLKRQSKQKKQNKIEPFYTLIDQNDTALQFESRFENGNLLAAYHPLDNDIYQLILQKDTNSNGYHQWFFFRVKNNTKAAHKVTLSIINLIRPRAKYSKGMKVWVYSEMKNKHEGLGWHHTCDPTSYLLNGLYYYRRGIRKNYSTLSFDYTFQYDDDYVYFANSIPYTYSDLMSDLGEYQKVENTKYPFFHRKTLCQTLAGNDLDYITINTSKYNDDNKDNNNPILILNKNIKANYEKEAIIFIARQHPSESPSSWVLKGAIEFLLGNSKEAIYLRDQFIFKIFPMMNPDGVIEGNTRTSFAGCDLNRRWKNPKEAYHPEIFYTKELITKIASQRKIHSLIDFHGHFGAFNSFFYCNDYPEDKTLGKAYPFITSIESNMINPSQFIFKMEKNKRSTCRISLYNELHIENILTLETSNFGFSYGENNNTYINIDTLKNIGRDVCIGLLIYQYYSLTKMNKEIGYLSDDLISKSQSTINKMEMMLKQIKKNDEEEAKIKEEDTKEIILKHESSINNKNEIYCSDDDLDSESEPSGDDLPFEDIQKLININRKNNRKIKKKYRIKKRLSTMIDKSKYKKLMITSNNNIHHSSSSNKNNNDKCNSNPNAIEITFPKLKPGNFTMTNQALKTSIQIKSNYGLNNNKEQKLALINTFNPSLSNKQLTKEYLLKTNGLNDKAKPITKAKIDMETQTEEIFFEKHWSYFNGLYTIISPTKKAKIVNLINNKVNVILDNESMYNFYLRKLFDLQRSKMISQRNKMIRHNMEQTRRYDRHEMRLMFGSLGDGSTSVTKNIIRNEWKNNTKRNGSETVRKDHDKISLFKK